MAIQDNLLDPRRKSPLALPLLVICLLGLGGGAFLLGRFSVDHAESEAAAAAAAPALDGVALAAGGAAGGTFPPEPPPAPIEPAMGDELPGTGGLRRLSVKIQGSLTQSINQAVGATVGDPLALVSSRLLVWWLSPARDLRPGDDLELVYSLPPGEEPMVHALHFRSGKLARAHRAYRYRSSEGAFARYYDEAGREIEERLQGGPIDGYEQITSLLKDGRGHKGVDFKAPVGTPVKMPWDGVVVRKNWNFRYNGGSLEVRDSKGRNVIFLHLDSVEKSLTAGSRVRKGQVVARAGNTGRSTAPHLHYQVMAGQKVLDPFDLHETYRTGLSAGEIGSFREAVADLDELLAGRMPIAAAADVDADADAGIVPAAARTAD